MPWFLREAEHFPDSEICEAYGNTCFRDLVEGRYDGAASSHCLDQVCLPDCEVVEYTFEFDDYTSFRGCVTLGGIRLEVSSKFN